MGILDFVVAIMVIATVAKLVQARYAAREFQQSDVEAARLRDEVRTLKERVQVLERVVTDNHGNHDLDRQIERLRDR